MKNAKKIVLLLLSLVLLCGVFAVAALAEEPASTATVVYPDGSVDAVAVGDTIVPKAFTDGLYYGAGNTLYKDDATEGWSFTLDGAALTDLTVTEAMVGKTIVAGGVDKVYSKIQIHFPEGDYWKWLQGGSVKLNGTYYYTAVFAQAGTSGTKTYKDYSLVDGEVVETENKFSLKVLLSIVDDVRHSFSTRAEHLNSLSSVRNRYRKLLFAFRNLAIGILNSKRAYRSFLTIRKAKWFQHFYQ